MNAAIKPVQACKQRNSHTTKRHEARFPFSSITLAALVIQCGTFTGEQLEIESEQNREDHGRDNRINDRKGSK